MQLQVINSELDAFWQDQNQKLIANTQFLNDRGTLFDDCLYFRSASRSWETKLDFSVFDLEHINISHAATLTLNDIAHTLSFKEYAKLLVVNNITSQSIYSAVPTLKMMLHLAAFLRKEDAVIITQNILVTFYQSYLTFSVNEKGRFFYRISPPSYRGALEPLNFSSMRLRLQGLGVTGVIDYSFTTKSLHSALGTACQSVMGLTLNEYKKGGSCNFLTMELGQYYIDYQRRVYDDDYFHTLVCVTAIRDVEQQFDLQKIMNPKLIGHWRKVMIDVIQGSFLPNKNKSNHKITRDKVSSAMEVSLFRNYQVYFEKVQSLRESNIHQVVKKLGLEMRFDAVEVIRVLMLQKYHTQKPFILDMVFSLRMLNLPVLLNNQA